MRITDLRQRLLDDCGAVYDYVDVRGKAMILATGNFSVTCPTLPRGITKADLTYDATEEVRDACRRHLHRYAMRHSAEYKAWFDNACAELDAEKQANDESYVKSLVAWSQRVR